MESRGTELQSSTLPPISESEVNRVPLKARAVTPRLSDPRVAASDVSAPTRALTYHLLIDRVVTVL